MLEVVLAVGGGLLSVALAWWGIRAGARSNRRGQAQEQITTAMAELDEANREMFTQIRTLLQSHEHRLELDTKVWRSLRRAHGSAILAANTSYPKLSRAIQDLQEGFGMQLEKVNWDDVHDYQLERLQPWLSATRVVISDWKSDPRVFARRSYRDVNDLVLQFYMKQTVLPLDMDARPIGEGFFAAVRFPKGTSWARRKPGPRRDRD
ncbi:hypothetical protein [Curtobacterium sp. MCPF17_021]|uniref:hypothetical protein n=1 Tax=Curtobacterium sp. MCPF17_021 TaxID=2175639 RepID=UPI000DA8DC9D|nr:hypothetical protein [Curtobacterium sp. MCPF17_021]WIE82807.1 hypothetical protein DEJ29_015680 [Curtobacterium sp. MCPF17_021]